MPTYEYICDACQNEFEKFQSITAEPIATCPQCGKDHVRRKISGGAAILFKGGGFYETDYRSASYTEAVKKEKGDASPTSDSKPADAPAAPAKPDTPKPEPAKSETKSPAAKTADSNALT